MQFCKSCGKPLKIQTSEESVNEINCSCGFLNKVISSNISFEENIKKKAPRNNQVLKDDSKQNLDGFPHKCKKCNHGFAEVKEMGIFYGDEAGVYLFKCKKCGYTERQSDGTGN